MEHYFSNAKGRCPIYVLNYVYVTFEQEISKVVYIIKYTTAQTEDNHNLPQFWSHVLVWERMCVETKCESGTGAFLQESIT